MKRTTKPTTFSLWQMFLLLQVLFVLMAGLPADAQRATSASYILVNDVDASGGLRSTSTSYILTDTIGQASAIGQSSSTSYTIDDGFWVFSSGEAYEAGDINGDGLINIFDLQLVINCILGSGSCDRCDLNDDGLYNIFDLQLVINAILAP